MAEPDDMHHEIEMGAESALGRPLRGATQERLVTLQARVDYLTQQLDSLVHEVRAGQLTEHDAADENRRLTEELAHARQLLHDFQAQSEAQN